MIRRLGSFLSALLVFGATSLAGGVPAHAAITPSSTAQQIATAISTTGNVTGTFISKPPSGTPDAVADSGSALAGFPTEGSSYGILTTGDASLAANASQDNFASANDGGGNVRGNSDYDVTILKIDLTAATGQNCLRVDFRFLSEEFPEFVGSSYNDAFIAELDTSNWTTSGSTIDEPNNFAFGPDGNPITINSTGATHMTAAEAAGTVYDGATQPLVAQTPITAGPHSVYFSIFDAGDQVYDSAVFLDNLFLGSVIEGQCAPGAKPNLALSLTVDTGTTATGVTGVALNQIPPTGIVQQTAPTQDAPIGKSPIGKSPIGKSPIGKSPIGKSPIGKSPIGKSPIGKSPIGKSPIGKSPIGKSPVSAFPLLRPGGWQEVLAHSCDFRTTVPQGVTLAQLLTDSCIADGNPSTFPELSPEAPADQRLTLDQINWALSPAANASMLALLLGDVTWNDFPGTSWCPEWISAGQATCPGPAGLQLSDPIIVTESNGLNIELTSLPVKTVSDIISPSTKTFFWGITVIDLNILGSFLGSVEIGQIPSANRGLFVDCSNVNVDCTDGSTQTLGEVFNLDPNTLTALKPDGTLGDLGMGILGPRTLSDITIAFLDPNAINWEDVPLSGMGLERLPELNPTNLLRYSLSYEVPCADSGGMQATVKLPDGFLYRPGSSTQFEDPIADPTPDGQGGLVWDLSSSSCSPPGSTLIQIDFQVMPGFSLGTFTSDASVKTDTTSALLEGAAAVTVGDGFVGNGQPGEAASVSGDAMFVGHLADPGQQAFFSFDADPGDQVSVSLSHLSRDYDLVLYAPAGAQEAASLRSTTPFVVPLGKAPLPDPLAGSGSAESLVPEALQDVPLVSGRVVAGISDFRGTEQEYITTTGVSGNDGNTYLVQVSQNNTANGPEPFVLTIRTSTPDALPDCSARTFPNTPTLTPLAAPVLGAADNTLVIVDKRRLEAAFGTADATLIMSKLQDLVTNHVADTGVRGQVLDLSFFSSVIPFGTADADPCSPANNNNVVRAINDVVDGLGGDHSGLENIVLVGEDDIIPHARILDGTTDGNERQFAGDTYFTDVTNQLGGAFGNGYFLSDTPYASLQPLSILGQTVYPMQVALGRLGGSAATIEATIDLFVASKGLADPRTATSDPRTALETDYDFFRDGGDLIHQSQASQVGAANAQRLTDATAPWDKRDLTRRLLDVRDEGDEDITSADSCLDGCFFGQDVVDGAVGPHFTGGLSPTIFGSRADLNGDGAVDGTDDSNEFYGSTSIIDGALDCDAWHNTENDGAAGNGTIGGSDDCTLIGYDGTPDGVTIEVVNGSFATADGTAIADGTPLPTVFDATTPITADISEADFAWSAIDGKVDANGDEMIDGDDCHLGLIGQADDVGLGDPIDGVDILGTGCGFAGPIDPADNGLVDMNIGATPPDVISPNAHYDQYRLLPAKQNANGSWRAGDLFTTQGIERLSGTPFRLRLLYGIGCHFGLDFPDRLAGNAPTGTDAERVLDWQQAYFGKGAAVLVGNLGFGFGDTATVAFSERLMANFAANLDGDLNLTVGQALVEAEKDYLTSLASFSPYDQKVLEQTIMWGFPMYRLPGGGGGSAPAAASAVSSSVADPAPDDGLGGVDATTVDLAPTFTLHELPDGSQFFDADGLTQSTHPYPVMPKTVTDLPAGVPIVDGTPLPTVFDATPPITADISESDFAWSAIGGKVDTNGDETIDGDDCHFGLIGQADDVGLGDPIDGVDVLGTGCGFAGAIAPALNGMVDMNNDQDITSADTCLDGCFFGHDVVDGAVGPNFTGGFSPTIFGSLADLNGDGAVDGADDSNAFYGDTSIIDGALDCDAWNNKKNDGAAGNGTINGSDDCTLIGYDGTTDGVTIQVVNGSFATAGPKIAKGALLQSGTISEEANFDVTFANATIDNSANEPATAFETVYPTTHQSIGTFVDQTGSPTQTLVVLPGLFRPDDDLTNSPSIGTFRKLETSEWQVTYGDPNDTTGPQFVSIEGTPGPSSTLFSVDVAGIENDDEVVVVRVAALLIGGTTYQTVDLTHGAGTLWTGTLPSDQVREFTVFALDSDGNVATANNRGIAYAPVDDTPPSIDVVVGDPKVESGGDTYVSSTTPITVTVGDLGSGTCTIKVFEPQNPTPTTRTCHAGDNTPFTLSNASGAYTINVTATDGAGNTSELSFELTIQGPVITITSPVEGATYALNEPVSADFLCSNGGFGVASCTGTQNEQAIVNGQAIDTATIGAKTFTVTATDTVGNTSTKTVTYYVGYKVCLRYDPSKPFRINTSTIPIKLTICDATGNNLSSASLTLTAVSLKNVTTGVITSPPPVNAGDGVVFRFDKNLVKPGGGYIYNLSTRGLPANNMFELRFTISNEASGTALHVAPFSTKP